MRQREAAQQLCCVLLATLQHVLIFDEGFPGEVPDGAAILVAKLRAAVNARWPGRTRKPTCVFVDRGKGFYNPGNGKITPESVRR